MNLKQYKYSDVFCLGFKPTSLYSDILNCIPKHSDIQNTQLLIVKIYFMHLICFSSGNREILESINKQSLNFQNPESHKLYKKGQKAMRSLI